MISNVTYSNPNAINNATANANTREVCQKLKSFNLISSESIPSSHTSLICRATSDPMRTLDLINHSIIKNIYVKGILRKQEIFGTYKHLDDYDFYNPNSPTSIIVSTNKERFTLTHTCAIGYAKTREKIVYR